MKVRQLFGGDGLRDQGGDGFRYRVVHLKDGKRGGPEDTVIEVRGFLESKRRIPTVELTSRLKETDDLVFQIVGRHSVPGPRGDLGGNPHDESVDSLRHFSRRGAHLRNFPGNLLLAGE